MEFEKVLKQIGQIGILPVVKIEAREQAAPLAECLERAGFPAVEITFRTGACTEAIREIKKKVPGVLVGAGGEWQILVGENNRPGRPWRQGRNF